MSYLVEYRNAIYEGEIIVGKEMLQLLENLSKDLENPKYLYDTENANLRIDFIEGLCKHSKDKFHGKPFKLMLWQKAFIETLYSFKYAQTGARRYNTCLLLVARKNGKSTLASALGITEFWIGKNGRRIICASNNSEQADIIFKEIKNMNSFIDPKSKWTRRNRNTITYNSKMSSIAKKSHSQANLDGDNISFAIIDEAHEMQNDELIASIKQSQSTQEDPLFLNITTEGFTNDGYLDKELVYCRKILNNEVEKDDYLVWLYTQDTELEIFDDENSWYKANPSLGEVKKASSLKSQVATSQELKSTKIHTMAKDFNIKQNNASAWLSQKDLENASTFDLDSFRGHICIGAVDLAETMDLCSVKILLMRKNDDTKYIYSHYFLPKRTVDRMPKDDKQRYKEWEKKGLITLGDELQNDFGLITKWFLDLYEKNGIITAMIGYDRWHSRGLIEEIKQVVPELVPVSQNFKGVSDGMNLLEVELKDKNINYNNNPIDKMCLINTAVDVERKTGYIRPIKSMGKVNNKIDGAVTLIMLMVLLTENRSRFMSSLLE